MTTPLAAKIAREYGTPAAVIDMDRVERNISRIQAACDAAGVANRPHIKTHKSPMLARMQVAAVEAVVLDLGTEALHLGLQRRHRLGQGFERVLVVEAQPPPPAAGLISRWNCRRPPSCWPWPAARRAAPFFPRRSDCS